MKNPEKLEKTGLSPLRPSFARSLEQPLRRIASGTTATILSILAITGCSDATIGNSHSQTDAYNAAIDSNLGEKNTETDTIDIHNDPSPVDVLDSADVADLVRTIDTGDAANEIDVAEDTSETTETDTGIVEIKNTDTCIESDTLNLKNSNAINVIGQLVDGVISFTKNDPDNGELIPNAIGLSRPTGIAIDTIHHRLFISDRQNNRIVIHNLDANNNLIDYVADNVLGQKDFSGSSGAVGPDRIDGPFQLVYDAKNDRLLVADRNNNRIGIYDTATVTDGESVINVLGQPDFTSKNPVTTEKGLNLPYGLALDHIHDRLFVADGDNNRIVIYDTKNITNGASAMNVLGQMDFASSNQGTTQNGLFSPAQLAYDHTTEYLYVADSWNKRVIIFDVTTITNGEPAIHVLGQPDFTTSKANTTQDGLSYPVGLTIDSSHKRLFIADGSNHRIVIHDTENITNGQSAQEVIGQPNFTEKTPGTSVNSLFDPNGILHDNTTNKLYIADFINNRVMIFKTLTDSCKK